VSINAKVMFPWFYANLERGQTVVVPDVSMLGEEASEDKRNLGIYGTKSTVVVPLFVGGVWLGVLSFSAVRQRRNFPEDLVKRFQFLADVFTNVLARKRADEALSDSEARFRIIADSAPVLIWMAGPDKLCTFFNKPWYDFTGRSVEQETGNGWTVGVHKDDLPDCLKTYIGSFDARQPFIMEYRLRRRDGEYRWISDNGIPRYHADGTFAGYIGSCVDITERRQSEEKLRKSLAEIQRLKEQLQAETEYLRAEIKVTQPSGAIVGQSGVIKRVLHQAGQVAPTDSTVLICGETGTGKELIADAIHSLSPRKGRLIVKVNCAALPQPLVESELFGREKGAYTGALAHQVGRFHIADQSTIFLDEVGEFSLEVQAKLLRVLQEGQFERLGSPRTIKVNVRLIAATNRDLAEEVRKGRFRQDLFYRLNVFPITIPPLRERVEDIPLLVWTFLEEFSMRMGKKIMKVPRRAMETLQRYSWPGNVRELRNVIERSVIISSGETLKIAHFQELLQTDQPQTLAANEREHILRILETSQWRIKGRSGAADKLGLKPSTLYTRMQKLGIPNRHQKDGIRT
jgi:PAS domain S-box-containing protein